MEDSKTMLSQVQEIKLILHEIHVEGMSMSVSESFQVATIIEKLPSSWKYFKNYLRHKCKEMWLEDLIVRLRIEEENRSLEKAVGNHYQTCSMVVMLYVFVFHYMCNSRILFSLILNCPNTVFYNMLKYTFDFDFDIHQVLIQVFMFVYSIIIIKKKKKILHSPT